MKTILIRLLIVVIIITTCVLCSCTNTKNKAVFMIEYTVFSRNNDTKGMDSIYNDKIVIKANDKYEMQRIFDTQIATKYDADSIAMHTYITAIFQ